MKEYKLAIFISHPIHYQVPLFKKLAEHNNIDLMVYYCNDLGVKKRKDHEFGILIEGNDSLLEGYRYKFLKNYSPNPTAYKFWGLINPGIIKELINNDYDAIVIHGYFYISCWLAYLGAWISRTPVFFRGETVLRFNQPAWRRAVKSFIIKVLSLGTEVFLTMGKVSEKFYGYYGIPKERLFHTPYAVNNDFFIAQSKKYSSQKNKLEEELGIDEQAPVILFVGKLVSRKRPYDLLRAFNKLSNRDDLPKKPYLIFVGEGSAKKDLENYTKKENIENVIFAGYKTQNELPKFYSLADIFVLPSEYEVSPLVINEAMCFSLPIILSDAIPSSMDFVQHGGNGYVFSLGSVNELSSYLAELVNSKSKREQFGRKSLSIIGEYSYEKDIEGILEALKHIKNNKR